jgi:tRNA dimethylallyltransferase
LAVELAVRFGGEIINTDSLQVYRYLDIGTAKPTPGEQAQARHHLIDLVNPDEAFSAGAYVAHAQAVLAALAQAGRVAILCGGTGLYFRALTEGLAEVPAIPADVRQAVETRLKAQGTPALHAELARLDPVGAAKLHPNDSARISRALEVVLATGTPIGRYRDDQSTAPPLGAVLHVGWGWDRAALYQTINRRVETMLAGGWIDEVRQVLARGYAPDAKPLRSIGYREIVEHLAGARAADTLAPDIQQRTRNYAKRQLTWFRHQTRVDWFSPGAADAVLRRVEAFLNTQHNSV